MLVLDGLVDRLISRWVAGFRSRHGLDPSNLSQDPIWAENNRTLSFLHIGCGQSRKQHTVPGFMHPAWHEIRLDANAAVEPDIVANMTSMPMVPDGAVKAIFSSHNIEHLYPHEVPVALAEFHRVLKSDGFLVVTCPDLQSVCQLVVADKLDEPAYFSPAGPIAPIDVLYGHRPQTAAGNLYMAHHCGFTLRTLIAAVKAAGFQGCYGMRRDSNFDIWLIAHKKRLAQDELELLATDFFPTPD